MRAVYKYPIRDAELPIGAEIVFVGEQDMVTYVWAIVDTNAEMEARHFRVIGTGHQIPEGAKYVQTFLQPPFVWHLFELEGSTS